MAAETQTTCTTSSKHKGFVAGIRDIHMLMTEIGTRCRSIANKIPTPSGELHYDRNSSLSLQQELRTLASDIDDRNQKLRHYEVFQSGIAHFDGDSVECDGETMEWSAFCAVRSMDGTISKVDDTVKVGEHVLTLDEYLVARAVHQDQVRTLNDMQN